MTSSSLLPLQVMSAEKVIFGGLARVCLQGVSTSISLRGLNLPSPWPAERPPRSVQRVDMNRRCARLAPGAAAAALGGLLSPRSPLARGRVAPRFPGVTLGAQTPTASQLHQNPAVTSAAAAPAGLRVLPSGPGRAQGSSHSFVQRGLVLHRHSLAM